MSVIKLPVISPSFKAILSAVKKLSPEEKQLLHLKLFGGKAILQLKQFEIELRKNKPVIKKSDSEIVSLTASIRKRQYAK